MTLEDDALLARQRILRMISRAGHGHIGSSLSSVELLTALYKVPLLEFDDTFIMSKGHACEALYAALVSASQLDEATLDTYGDADSILSHETSHKVPGVKLTTGSVGHGLSVACGVALAKKRSSASGNAVVLLGDAECQEGSVWEAALFAAHHQLDNLIAIVDRNGLAILDTTEHITKLEPFEQKWNAFGWRAIELDGHSFDDIQQSFNARRWVSFDMKPLVLIAKTVKGKGVSFMENDPQWHHGVPQGSELEQAERELGLRDD